MMMLLLLMLMLLLLLMLLQVALHVLLHMPQMMQLLFVNASARVREVRHTSQARRHTTITTIDFSCLVS